MKSSTVRAWAWRAWLRRVQGCQLGVAVVLAAALYVLAVLALGWVGRDTLGGFQQLHRLSTGVVLEDRHFRQPVMGPLRVVHASGRYVTHVMRQAAQFLQDHNLQEAGEPWVKAVGVLALRQVRNPDAKTSIYRQGCNWTAQDTAHRGFESSLAPPAWRHTWSAGLPPMQGGWCTVPDGGYYLGLRLHDLASHEQCRAASPPRVGDCVRHLVQAIMDELEHDGWVDALTCTVTVSLTMFDFRHGLAGVVAVVAERQTTASWLVTSRVSLTYSRGHLLPLLALVAVILTTALDLFFSRHLRLVKRALLLAVDTVLLLTVLTLLIMHFTKAKLLGAATQKFLEEIKGQPRQSNTAPFGNYEGIEPLARTEQIITTLETVWTLGLLVKILSLEWYVTRGFTSFILILRRALRKSYSLVFTIVLLVVVHAAAFYRFFGGRMREFEFLDDSFSAMVGYTVGNFDHESFFATSLTWKALFLVSAFMLFVLGSQYVLTLFLAAAENMNEMSDSVQGEEGRSEDPKEEEDSDDELFLRIVKEELERTLTSKTRGSNSTRNEA